jgi:hypothetical protein
MRTAPPGDGMVRDVVLMIDAECHHRLFNYFRELQNARNIATSLVCYLLSFLDWWGVKREA